MADGFIVRRGGKGSEQALAPTITEVSKTDTQIVFTIKNNDTSSAVILWEIGDTTPDANSLELAADTTSSNITVTGLADDTTFIVYATANVTGKIKSEVASQSITTDASQYALSFDGVDDLVNLGNITLSNEITVYMDFKPTGAGNTNFTRLFNIENIFSSIWDDLDDALRFFGQGKDDLLTSTNSHPVNNRYQLVWTGSSTSVKVYENGSEIGSLSFTGGDYSNAIDAFLGNRADGLRAFKGEMYEIQVYDTVLNSTQIGNLPTPQTDIIHHWDFSDGTGTTLTDIVGNRNGTITGATWVTL